jgi:hypothetical protein
MRLEGSRETSFEGRSKVCTTRAARSTSSLPSESFTSGGTSEHDTTPSRKAFNASSVTLHPFFPTRTAKRYTCTPPSSTGPSSTALTSSGYCA